MLKKLLFLFIFTIAISEDFSDGPYGSEYFNIAGPFSLPDSNLELYGDANIDYFYEEKSDTTKSTGGNSYTNTQYSLYSNQGGNIKVKQGGITTSQYYAYYAPIYLNNVVDNYSGSHNVQNNHAIYAKNYDGVSGQVLNKYQHGTVEKETSIRHTASGFSW